MATAPAQDRPGAVLVTGGTGFVGRALLASLAADGRPALVMSRDPGRAQRVVGPDVRVVRRPDEIPTDTAVDAVVALAGARVLGTPWSPARRHELLASRIDSIGDVVAWMAGLARRPRVVVGASAVGFYGARPVARRAADEPPAGQPLDEQALSQPGQFQSDLCIAIEAALARAAAPATRVVALRLGVVLGRGGGAWPGLALPARLGFAAILGSGRQALPWIHLDDAVGLICLAIDDERLAGPVNAVAPDVRTQADFTRTLAASFGRPAWLHVPAAPMRVALGEMSDLLLEGQNPQPRAALAAGYAFRHPRLDEALSAIARG